MRLNRIGKTVRAMDILFPGLKKIVGMLKTKKRLILAEKIEAARNYEKETLWY